MGNKFSQQKPSGEKSKLITVTILHRHGARGPGASELSPWDDNCKNDIKRQWKENEIEAIHATGHAQIKTLGEWFVSKAKEVSAEEVAYFWRCSKSGRARESGEDFTQAFNAKIGSEAFPKAGLPYDVDADNYFRPWKIYEAESKISKQQCMLLQQPWFEMVHENEKFLRRIFAEVGAVDKMTNPIGNSLWATTYLMALRESEEFWPEPAADDVGAERTAMAKTLTSKEDWEKVESIALWVWSQRFLSNGFQRKIGGKIAREMLQRTLYNDGSVNVFSGHDYTLLSLLSNLLPEGYKMKTPTSFGGYILLQLWEGPPPTHSGLASCVHPQASMKKTPFGAKERVVRVIYNPCPFKNKENHVDGVVNDDKEEVLLELTLTEAEKIVKDIDDYFSYIA